MSDEEYSGDDQEEAHYAPSAEADEEAMSIARGKLVSYWDQTFSNKESGAPDEWFLDYATLEPFLAVSAQQRLRILVAGCGFSQLGVELSKRGHLVVNLDISTCCIREMKSRCGAFGEWIVGDVTNMVQIRDRAFDLVIDKGTSDTLSFRTRYFWFPTLSLETVSHCHLNSKRHFVGQLMVRSFFAESYRVLVAGGRLLIVTTKVKVRGLHADPPPKRVSGHDDVVVDDGVVEAGWWKREDAQADAAPVVLKSVGNEKCKLKPQRKLRPHRNIEPIINYPFSKFSKVAISSNVNIPGEFHERKKVYVHSATK